MENKRGTLSHLAPIIRIILFIIFIAIIAFFVIRFFRNRQESRRAQQTAQVAQPEQRENQNGSREEGSRTQDSGADSQRQQNMPVPGGINDSQSQTVPNTGPEALPETGASTSTLLSIGLIGVVVYSAYQLRLSRTKLLAQEN